MYQCALGLLLKHVNTAQIWSHAHAFKVVILHSMGTEVQAGTHSRVRLLSCQKSHGNRINRHGWAQVRSSKKAAQVLEFALVDGHVRQVRAVMI